MGNEHETGQITSTFKDHGSENKLLQELGDEMFIIISNTVQSKISPFIKFVWEDQFPGICCHHCIESRYSLSLT